MNYVWSALVAIVICLLGGCSERSLKVDSHSNEVEDKCLSVYDLASDLRFLLEKENLEILSQEKIFEVIEAFFRERCGDMFSLNDEFDNGIYYIGAKRGDGVYLYTILVRIELKFDGTVQRLEITAGMARSMRISGSSLFPVGEAYAEGYTSAFRPPSKRLDGRPSTSDDVVIEHASPDVFGDAGGLDEPATAGRD